MSQDLDNQGFADQLLFRAANGEKLVIKINIQFGHFKERVHCGIQIMKFNDARIKHRLQIYNPSHDNSIDIGNPRTIEAVKDYIKDLILSGNWQTPSEVLLNSTQDNQSKGFSINGNTLIFSRDINSLAEENRIARWLILERLYRAQQSQHSLIVEDFNFPEDAVFKAIEVLNDLGYIQIIDDSRSRIGKLTVRLKAAGMRYFEEISLPAHNQVFIIAPCAEQGIIRVFKKVLGEKGYSEENLIVQEVREPKEETIRDAILTNIRSCKFIMADITGGHIKGGKRFNPNCLYELGWAHALKKKVICTVRRDMAFSKHQHTKISYLPFDISIIPFSFWDEKKEVDISDELLRKIDDIHKYFQSESWPNA
jgi:hypothetical protein